MKRGRSWSWIAAGVGTVAGIATGVAVGAQTAAPGHTESSIQSSDCVSGRLISGEPTYEAGWVSTESPQVLLTRWAQSVNAGSSAPISAPTVVTVSATRQMAHFANVSGAEVALVTLDNPDNLGWRIMSIQRCSQ